MSTNIKAATQNLRALKQQVKEPWWKVLTRTVFGAFVVAFGVGMVVFFGAPWWVAVVGAVWGAHTWKGELVTEFLKTVPKLVAGAILDIIRALKGDGGADPPPQG